MRRSESNGTRTRTALALSAASLTLVASLSGCVVVPFGLMGDGMAGNDRGYGDGRSRDPGAGRAEQGGDAEFNRVDLMFTVMMIPHHEDAVEMSDLILATSGIDPAVRDLATRIKAAQQPEIVQMQGLLDAWGEDGRGPSGMMGGMDGMHGMMSESDMARLDAASGEEAERIFLSEMVEHHEGAIDMSWPVVRDGQNPELRALAKSIIESQTAEIAEMRELLARR